MIKLTKVNYRHEIQRTGLSQEAKGVLIGAVNAAVHDFIPPLVESEKKFDRIKAEIGPVSIDGEELELTKLATDDKVSFRTRLKPISSSI